MIRISNGKRVATRVSYNRRSNRVVINPSKALPKRTAFRAEVTGAVKDLAGNKTGPVRCKFRTGVR